MSSLAAVFNTRSAAFVQFSRIDSMRLFVVSANCERRLWSVRYSEISLNCCLNVSSLSPFISPMRESWRVPERLRKLNEFPSLICCTIYRSIQCAVRRVSLSSERLIDISILSTPRAMALASSSSMSKLPLSSASRANVRRMSWKKESIVDTLKNVKSCNMPSNERRAVCLKSSSVQPYSLRSIGR